MLHGLKSVQKTFHANFSGIRASRADSFGKLAILSLLIVQRKVVQLH
jgi:hypothetical protein